MKKVMITTGLLLALAGCSSNTTASVYEQSMEKAKDAIEEKKFEKAEAFLDMALDNQKNDQKATNMQKQLAHVIEAETDKEEQKITEAKKELQFVTTVKDGSEQLVKYAKEDLKKLADEKTTTSSDLPDKPTTSTETTEATSESSSETTTSTEIETETVESMTVVEPTLWNNGKATQLANFMSSWGQTMGQQYESYAPGNNVSLYGAMLPDLVLSGEWSMAVNETPVSVEWSTEGVGSADYQLVAVYSDAKTQPGFTAHVYFFVLQNEQPKVLVTQQNQGNQFNYLYFHETENSELRNGFNQIVLGAG